MNVTVFGAGYVGLVQAAILAEVGHKVICVDVDQSKVTSLTLGHIPIFEPGLTAIVKSCIKNGSLRFTTNAKIAVEHGEIIFIAVGTPPDEDGSADLKYVLSVAKTIADHMNDEKIVVTKSTVPVGTSEKVHRTIALTLAKQYKSILYHVVSNPEFLKEGSAIADCKKPDRIIIGSDNDDVIKKMRTLYEAFNHSHDRIITMDVRSAELTKYVANCMLATKISFMNEIANIAEKLGADIEHVRKGIGSDSRIGYSFIYPGCGYGGSCFPKDVKALIQTSDESGYTPSILKAVEAVNLRQKQTLFTKINNEFKGHLKGKVVALWGLSFKPNTDDMRESPSRELIERLWGVGAIVQAYDPEAMKEAERIYGKRDDFILMKNKEDALVNADMLVLCTEWKTFWNLDYNLLKNNLKTPVVFDGRNLYSPTEMNKQGFTYYGVGRGKSLKTPSKSGLLY